MACRCGRCDLDRLHSLLWFGVGGPGFVSIVGYSGSNLSPPWKGIEVNRAHPNFVQNHRTPGLRFYGWVFRYQSIATWRDLLRFYRRKPARQAARKPPGGPPREKPGGGRPSRPTTTHTHRTHPTHITHNTQPARHATHPHTHLAIPLTPRVSLLCF